MVKTHLSLSHDPDLKGRPRGWTLPIRDILVYKGAGFVVPVAGDIKLMPGTGSDPAFRRIDVDVKTGKVHGPLLIARPPASRACGVGLNYGRGLCGPRRRDARSCVSTPSAMMRQPRVGMTSEGAGLTWRAESAGGSGAAGKKGTFYFFDKSLSAQLAVEGKSRMSPFSLSSSAPTPAAENRYASNPPPNTGHLQGGRGRGKS